LASPPGNGVGMRSTTITDDGRKIRSRLIAVAVVIVVLNLLNFAARALSGRQVVEGPDGSSNATTATGASAWKELLEAVDIPTGQLEQSIKKDQLDPVNTLVVLEPGFWEPAEIEVMELRRFLMEGGRLVLGGWISGGMIDAVGGTPPSRRFSGPTSSTVVAPHAVTQGVSTVVSPGQGSFADPDGLGAIGSGESATVLIQQVGEGTIVHLADAGIVSNAYIGEADNAILAVNLAGNGGVVIFNEFVHGYGARGLLPLLPERWNWALGLLGGAVLVWMVAVGRRLGPPEREHRDFSPERSLYVDSLGALMARSKQPGIATDIIRAKARAGLITRTGLPDDASTEQLRASAIALGLDEVETNALLTGAVDDASLIAADRALAKITRGEL